MDNTIINWLLESNPWTEYRTRLDLLDEAADSPDVLSVRKVLVNHEKIKSLFEELKAWPGEVLKSHKSAGQLYHKLSFIAELGITIDDPGIMDIASKVRYNVSDEGPFQLKTNIPTHFGGTGKDQYAWMLCDTPLLVYSLIKMCLGASPDIIKAKNYLVQLGTENGYPCAATKELGKFHGPGKKGLSCPYATLLMLKLLSLDENDRNSKNSMDAIDSLLNLWENSRSLHPFIFYMGTDFRKLKAPLIWYDILHLADTLSNFDYARNDLRYNEITQLISQKVDSEGKLTPESVWRAWKDWDFGQKKLPSPWLSFLVYRILHRKQT